MSLRSLTAIPLIVGLGGCSEVDYKNNLGLFSGSDTDTVLDDTGTSDDTGEADCIPTGNEICDGGIDNDCNGLSDDEDPGVVYTSEELYALDNDLDGYGTSPRDIGFCSDPGIGYSTTIDDCDDNDALAYPGAKETCADGKDSDCDLDVTDNDQCWAGSYDVSAITDGVTRIVSDDDFAEVGTEILLSDTNCDGLDDLVIGAPGEDYDARIAAGGVFVLQAPFTPLISGSAINIYRHFAQIRGEDDAGALGKFMMTADGSADGCSDIYGVAPYGGEYGFGAFYTVYGSTTHHQYGTSGGVYDTVYFDPDADSTSTPATREWGGYVPLNNFGGELLIGASFINIKSSDDPFSALYIADTTLPTGVADESIRYIIANINSGNFGETLLSGDFSGDGESELLACSPDEEKLYIINSEVAETYSEISGEGSFSYAYTSDIPTFVTDSLTTGAGWCHFMNDLGDIDGDGISDFTAGGYSAGYLFYGRNDITALGDSTEAFARFENNSSGMVIDQVTALGDINGDGVVDFAVSLSGEETSGVALFYGPLLGHQYISAAHAYLEDPLTNGFGKRILALGDIGDGTSDGSDEDGIPYDEPDGLNDFAIANPKDAAGGVDAGAVTIFYGRDGE